MSKTIAISTEAAEEDRVIYGIEGLIDYANFDGHYFITLSTVNNDVIII